MAIMQRFKLLATQCGEAQSRTRSPRTSPIVTIRRRKSTLRMLLSRSGSHRWDRRSDPLPEKRNEKRKKNERSLVQRQCLKELFVSSPLFEIGRGQRDTKENMKHEDEGKRVDNLIGKVLEGGTGSPRPVWTGLRSRWLLKRAWRPMLVPILE